MNRNANVDLTRIIATMFVIILHVLGIGGILRYFSPNTVSYWVIWLLEIFAFGAVNIFALVSGYIMVNKNIKLKSILGLWFQVLFYSCLIGTIFFVFVPETRVLKNIVFTVLPILGGQWWYITAYFGLYIFIPILNSAVNHISRNIFRAVLFVSLILFCTAGVLAPNDPFVFNSGYSVIWLILIYLFGAYIKKYEVHKDITARKSLIGFLCAILVGFLIKFGIYFGTKYILGNALESDFVSYMMFTTVFAAIFVLLFCLNIKINTVSQKIISFFAPLSLGIYLIHSHPLVFRFVLEDLFLPYTKMSLGAMIGCVLLTTIVIYLLCATIEWLRIQLFKVVHMNELCGFLEKKITCLYAKIFKD